MQCQNQKCVFIFAYNIVDSYAVCIEILSYNIFRKCLVLIVSYITQLCYSVQFSVDTAHFPSQLLSLHNHQLVITLSGENSHVEDI